MAKGPGQRPQPASQEGSGDEDEASGGADGAITAKDGQGSENCLIFDKYTYPLEFQPVRVQWHAPDRTGPDRFQSPAPGRTGPAGH